jgi:adenosylmethionine---8-amino-7-oxononanoate aminotransferase
MHKLAKLDHRYVWHPFTQMKDWLEREPIVITSGSGSVLRDANGREYLDANASIWTNLHGHNHPALNKAITKQLKKIAHSSALGLANEPASLLAERLVNSARLQQSPRGKKAAPARAQPMLAKVFYSDDGSTALEVALKLSYQVARRIRGTKKPRFLSLEGAYHGDTVGAVSVGHIDLFHGAYGGLLFKSDKVMAPYCYRCPYNRAAPQRADARTYRNCRGECVRDVERAFVAQAKRGEPYAGFVVEPLMQGAAGMIAQPAGWLSEAAALARAHKAPLIADEVMTGFGRTGGRGLFACHNEGVQPDYLCVAKGLTGGYLPMAATLTTQEVFDAFLGEYEQFKTFFHGHSYTGNQLGSAAALASLELLAGERSERQRRSLESALAKELENLWRLPSVGDIRRVGLVAGIELVQDWQTKGAFPLEQRVGIRVCEAMAKRGVLTRPVGNVIVLMPPYCTTAVQLRRIVTALYEAIEETLPASALSKMP